MSLTKLNKFTGYLTDFSRHLYALCSRLAAGDVLGAIDESGHAIKLRQELLEQHFDALSEIDALKAENERLLVVLEKARCVVGLPGNEQRINKGEVNKMATRQDVFSVIHDERIFQDRKWGSPATLAHGVGGYLTIMRKLLTDAEAAWVSSRGDTAALDELRKVVAVGVACMEQHGTVSRKVVDFAEQSGNFVVSRATHDLNGKPL